MFNFLSNLYQGASHAVGNFFHPQPQAPQPQQHTLGQFLGNTIGNVEHGVVNQVHQAAPQIQRSIGNVVNPVIRSINGNPIVHGAENFVNQGVVQPIVRGGQQLTNLSNATNLNPNVRRQAKPVNIRQLATDAATTGLNFAGGDGAGALLKGGASFGAKVLRGALEGGALGAAQGGVQSFGNKDNLGNTAKNVLGGAAIGGAAGGALPVVGAGAKLAFKGVAKGINAIANTYHGLGESGHIALPTTQEGAIKQAQQAVADIKSKVAVVRLQHANQLEDIHNNPQIPIEQKPAAIQALNDRTNAALQTMQAHHAEVQAHLMKLDPTGQSMPTTAAPTSGVQPGETTLLDQQMAEQAANAPKVPLSQRIAYKAGEGIGDLARGVVKPFMREGQPQTVPLGKVSTPKMVLNNLKQTLGNERGTADLGASIGGEAKPKLGKVEPTPQDTPLQLGKGTKQQAKDLRYDYVGDKNAHIVRGNQLSDQVKKLAPKEQKAIFWYNEAKGNKDTLKSWATDGEPKIKPHVEDIKAALNLSEKGKEAAGMLKNYYDQAGKDALDHGVIKSIREDYNNNRLYKPDQEGSSVKAGTRDLNVTTSHAKQRVYNTMHEAVLNGKVPATTNAADLMSIHNEEMAKVTASKNLVKNMTDRGLGKLVNDSKEIPQGWKAVDVRGIGFSQKFVAPEHLAGGLRAITDPNFLDHYSLIKNVRKFQGVVKTVDLSYSLFHHLTMTTQMLGQTASHPVDTAKLLANITGGMDIKPIEQDFVTHGGITSKLGQNMDVLHSLAQSGDSKTIDALKNAPGFKQLAAGTQKSSEFLFGTVQRYLKTFDYGQKAANWVAKNPNATNEEVTAAKRSLAKEVNNAYGGLNMEAMGIDKSVQSAMRTVFLAPDWLLSNFAIGKQAFERNPGGAAARANIATTVIGGMLATEALNKTLTGHWTNQNEKGHPFEVQVQPGVYISLMRGGIGDLIKLGSMMAENGPTTGAGRYFQGKLSPFARTALGAFTGKNYYGQSITKKGDSPMNNVVNEGKFLVGSSLPVPFGIGGISSYLQNSTPQNPANPAAGALVASGLARYSKPTSPGMAATASGSTPNAATGQSSALTDATGTPEAKAAAAAKRLANANAVAAGTRLGGTKSLDAAQTRIDAANKRMPGNLPQNAKDVLTNYAKLSAEGKAKFNADPSNKFQLSQAQYQQDVASGKLSGAKQFQAQQSLGKEAITSKYPQDVLDFYNLSKNQAAAYFKQDPAKAKDLYAQAQQLDQQLNAHKFSSTPKYKYGLGSKPKKLKVAKVPSLFRNIGRVKSVKIAKVSAPRTKSLKLAKMPTIKAGSSGRKKINLIA